MTEHKYFEKNMRYIVLIGLIILLIVTFSLMSKSFFDIGTLMNFIRQNAVLFVASIGMLLVMLTGGLDLSVGSTGALAGMSAALLMTQIGMSSPIAGWLGILIVILVGLI